MSFPTSNMPAIIAIVPLDLNIDQFRRLQRVVAALDPVAAAHTSGVMPPPVASAPPTLVAPAPTTVEVHQPSVAVLRVDPGPSSRSRPPAKLFHPAVRAPITAERIRTAVAQQRAPSPRSMAAPSTTVAPRINPPEALTCDLTLGDDLFVEGEFDWETTAADAPVNCSYLLYG